MVAAKPQAISGVSAGRENTVMVVYPSIAAMGIGRAIGSLMDAIPIKVFGPKLSQLLFAPLTAPVALAAYLGQKVIGECYLLTNNSIVRKSAFGGRRLASVALSDISDIELDVQNGQPFYNAADLRIISTAGETLMRLQGVDRPDVFRQTILEARDARGLVRESLATIQARQTA